MEVKLATFGQFPIGTTLKAPLYYLGEGVDGCSDLSSLDHSKAKTETKGFVLLHDGNCTYEEKARRVQEINAEALIIYEDPESVIDSRLEHMYDSSKYDGSGASVSIPSLIVSAEDGLNLISLINEGE